MSKTPYIAVFGSLHYDVIVRATALPRLGETAVGASWSTKRGGKGANQAAQAAYHGAQVYMIGRVGSDAEGDALLESLARAGVDIHHVSRAQGAPSGMSVAIIDAEGDYGAVIVSGANAQVGDQELSAARALIAGASLLVLQLELDLAVVARAAELAKANGVPVLLNAAPAYPLPEALSAAVDYLVVNQVEAEMLTGMPVTTRAEAEGALTRLEAAAPTVIVTLGGQGVVFSGPAGGPAFLPAYDVEVVDAHGAGDSFVGALCARLTSGAPLASAVAYANATAALVVSTKDSDVVEPKAVEELLRR